MKQLIVLALLLAGGNVLAGQIISETTENGAKTRWSVVNINADGVMRIDEGGYGASVSTADAGSMQASSVTYTKGNVRDTIIYNPQPGEIMSVEGNICRVLSADSAPPPGMGFMNSPEMAQHQQQMAAAMSNKDRQIQMAIQQLEQSGASQADIDRMKQMLGAFDIPGMQQPETPSYSFELLDGSASAGDFNGRRYSISDQHGAERFRVVMVPVNEVPGGRKARDGMDGMMGVFEQYMQGSGLPIGLGDGLMDIMQNDEFAGDYPALIEDLQENSITAIVSASDDAANVDFAPQCERRGMME
ncbi:MAG: hypothetical protein AAFN50_09795 [Pseudomonadota bacterium]